MRTYRPTEPVTFTYYAARRYGSDMALLPAHVNVSGLSSVANGGWASTVMVEGFDIPVSGTVTYALAREIVLYACDVRGYDLEDADWHMMAGDLTDTGRAMGWARDLTADAPLVLVAD